MHAWFKRLVGGEAKRRPGRLAAMLGSYPAYRVPYPGGGWFLTLAQAEANLAYLLEHKAGRLGLIGGVLREFGLDLPGGLAAAETKPFLDDVWRWTAAEWPGIYDPTFADRSVWLNSRLQADKVVFSLVQDVAILLGEMVLVRRSDYAWRLDLDPENRGKTPEQGMQSWQRPVVMRLADEIVPEIMFDFSNYAFSAYLYCSKPGYGFSNSMAGGVFDAVSGAHEVVWREAAERVAGRGRLS